MVEIDRSRARISEAAPQLRVVSSQPSGPPHWTGLADAGNEAEFCSAWLASQCANISGLAAGLLMMPPPARGRSVASTSWPDRNPYLHDLMRIAERAALERQAVALSGRPAADPARGQSVGLFLAFPVGP